MPVVGIPTEILRELVGEDLSDTQLDDLLDRLGCDVEGIAEVNRLQCPRCAHLIERGTHEDFLGVCPQCQSSAGDDPATFWKMLGQETVIRMELLPVRPDLFDVGGLARAIRGLLGKETGVPRYDAKDSGLVVEADERMASPDSYWPYIECAVLRGVKLTDRLIRQIMKMQEDVHWALGRDRKFASIGIYDLKGLEGPIAFRPVGPTELEFVPLASTDGKAVTPKDILEHHPKGRAYADHLANFKAYPLLIDANGQVLSMPPIINSHETALTTNATDLFIDVTGIGPRPVAKSMNVVTSSLLELLPGARLETVTIVREGKKRTTPDFTPQPFTLDPVATAKMIGMPLEKERVRELLTNMRHDAVIEGDRIAVQIPAYRNDILHEVDLMEDIAIAIGLANIPRALVPSFTQAQERPERGVQRRARTVLNGLGYAEVMSLMLTNPADHYEKTRRPDPGNAVLVDNPASQDQSMLRTDLASSLLVLLAQNRGAGLTLRMFEADDVVRIEPGEEEPVEALRIAAALQDRRAGFADIKAVCDAIGRELGLAFTYETSSDPLFLEGRGAELRNGDRTVGVLGEVHPAVLENFNIQVPVALLELEWDGQTG